MVIVVSLAEGPFPVGLQESAPPTSGRGHAHRCEGRGPHPPHLSDFPFTGYHTGWRQEQGVTGVGATLPCSRWNATHLKGLLFCLAPHRPHLELHREEITGWGILLVSPKMLLREPSQPWLWDCISFLYWKEFKVIAFGEKKNQQIKLCYAACTHTTHMHTPHVHTHTHTTHIDAHMHTQHATHTCTPTPTTLQHTPSHTHSPSHTLQSDLLTSCCCSVTKSRPTLWPHELRHSGLPCPLLSPGVCSNSLSWWCYPTISSSVVPFSSCPQSFPASGSFLMSQLLASCGQSIGASASASVLPMNNQDWLPLGLIGLISMQSKGLSRVFYNTIVQKHQFFGAQSSLCSNSRIHTWLLEKPYFWLCGPLLAK